MMRWLFQNLLFPAAQEISDSKSVVTPRIIMKNDGILYHQVSSFSPEHRTNVVLQERGIVGSVYSLPWRYSLVQYYLINVIRLNERYLHSTLCRENFFFRRGEPGFFHSFDWRFKFGPYERAQVSSIPLHYFALRVPRKVIRWR